MRSKDLQKITKKKFNNEQRNKSCKGKKHKTKIYKLK